MITFASPVTCHVPKIAREVVPLIVLVLARASATIDLEVALKVTLEVLAVIYESCSKFKLAQSFTLSTRTTLTTRPVRLRPDGQTDTSRKSWTTDVQTALGLYVLDVII